MEKKLPNENGINENINLFNTGDFYLYPFRKIKLTIEILKFKVELFKYN